MNINIAPDSKEMGIRSAKFVAEKIQQLVAAKEGSTNIRVIVATGASQFTFIEALVQIPNLPWDRVEFFHLDEYVGLDQGDQHPASFRKYLNERLFSKLNPSPAAINLVDPDNIDLYAELLAKEDIDLACIGIGENGHVAFNDPPVADFEDPVLVKIVELDDACRQQQVGEGWFDSIETSPSHAVTLTVPAIMRCKTISCVVPDERKAKAVYGCMNDEIGPACPATCLRQHPDTYLWLDEMSASLLNKDNNEGSK
jgi:glucosamine-6-phosphate deaminase